MPRYTNKQFEEAIKGSGGIITTIARRVGCHWDTADARIRRSPRLHQLLANEASMIDDLAQSVVIKAMQGEDVQTAKWWLERRRRGEFATRQEVSGPEGGPIEHVVTTIEVVRPSDGRPSDGRPEPGGEGDGSGA